MSKQHVFVYGSLLNGLSNHRLIADQTFISKATTVDDFNMVALWGFPGLLGGDAMPNPEPVPGELYAVDREGMKMLDRLESNGNFYQRYIIEADTPEGDRYECWCYFLINEYEYKWRDRVKGNDWFAHCHRAGEAALQSDN